MSNMNIGWQLLLLGMGTVFVVLYVLSLILKVMGKYLGPKQEKAFASPAQPEIHLPQNTEDEKAKVAAIMAAVQLVMGDTDYRLISIKPASLSTWKQAVNLGGQEFKYGGRKGK